MDIEPRRIAAKIVILDGHEVFGLGLQEIIADCGPQCSSVLTGSYDHLSAHLSRDPGIGFAIIDLSAPGMTGMFQIKQLRDKFPATRILMVNAVADRDVVIDCLVHGAHGCMFKTQPRQDIAKAVQFVLTGGIYVPDAIHSHSLPQDGGSVAAFPLPVGLTRAPPMCGTGSALAEVRLSRQQQAVLRLLQTGLSNKAIARELNLAEGTVKVHVNAVFRALNVNSRVQAVVRMSGTY